MKGAEKAMKIKIPFDRAPGESILSPIDPPPLLDINNFFILNIFRASKTTFSPFEELEIEWSISPINLSIDFADYEFTLNANDTILAESLDAFGVIPFSPHKNTLLRIRGRKRAGGSFTTLGDTISLTVDESKCMRLEVPSSVIDAEVKNAFSDIANSSAVIRLRKGVVNSNPFQIGELEVVSNWSLGSIEYYFPLEIVINNYFNGNLDVTLTITCQVNHSDTDSEFDVTINHTSDVDFDSSEDILSLGSSAIIAETADRLLPLLLDCKLKSIELQIIRMVMTYLSPFLDDHRLLAVRIIPLGNLSYIAFVLCPI